MRRSVSSKPSRRRRSRSGPTKSLGSFWSGGGAAPVSAGPAWCAGTGSDSQWRAIRGRVFSTGDDPPAIEAQLGTNGHQLADRRGHPSSARSPAIDQLADRGGDEPLVVEPGCRIRRAASSASGAADRCAALASRRAAAASGHPRGASTILVLEAEHDQLRLASTRTCSLPRLRRRTGAPTKRDTSGDTSTSSVDRSSASSDSGLARYASYRSNRAVSACFSSRRQTS